MANGRYCSCYKTFFVDFGFIQSEKSHFTYRFILRDLHDIYRQLNLPDPRVVLNDKGKALMNARVSRPNFLSQSAVYLVRQQEYSRAEPSSVEIVFLYSEITIHSSYLDWRKAESNNGRGRSGRGNNGGSNLIMAEATMACTWRRKQQWRRQRQGRGSVSK